MKRGAKVFIKNEALGKYLFILRDNKPGIVDQNCWGLVGGGIEDSETPQEALKREISEEVGIEILDLRPIHKMIVRHKVDGCEEIKGSGTFFSKLKTSAGQARILTAN